MQAGVSYLRGSPFDLLPLWSVKALTREQLEARKAKAVRFIANVLQDEDRADEVEDESLESYAERRHVQLLNPTSRKGTFMAGESKADLKRHIRELEDENQELQSKLDDIADLVAPEEDEVEEEEEDGGAED